MNFFTAFRTGTFLSVRRFLFEARKETLQDRIRYQIDIRLAEPYTGNVWFKLVTENTEIVEEEDKLLLVPERPEGNRLSVFAIIENVPVAGKTITL